jgi:hypothetical protein
LKKNRASADDMTTTRKAGIGLESAAKLGFPARHIELPRTKGIAPAKRALPIWDWFNTAFSQTETLVPDRDADD